ncbi:B12-binding domain-containing radical SAM protein, partial [Elusimicrobiota bacterium]
MCKQKILLVKPYTGRINSATAPPLGLLYLASYVRNKNKDYDIKLMDMRVDKSSINDLLDLVGAYKPGIIGISVCSEEDEMLHEIAANIKKTYPDIIVIAGGPHVTLAYNDIIKDDSIDFLVIGEGEVTFYELIESIRHGRDLTAVP